MIGHEPTPSFEQLCPLLLVNTQVVGQALASFLDVSSCLVQGQRQAVHGPHNVEGCCLICHRGTLEGGIVRDDACSPQNELGSLFCFHGVQLDLAGETSHRLSSGGQQDVSFVPFWQIVTEH